MSELTVSSVKKLKVVELKAELTKRGLAVKGKKDELAKRLIQALKKEGCVEDGNQSTDCSESFNDSQASLNDSQDKETDDNSTLEESNVENISISETEKNTGNETNETIKDPKDLVTGQENDDWIMVEPPKDEETGAVNDAASEQDKVTLSQILDSHVDGDVSIIKEEVTNPDDDVAMSEQAVDIKEEINSSNTNKDEEKASASVEVKMETSDEQAVDITKEEDVKPTMKDDDLMEGDDKPTVKDDNTTEASLPADIKDKDDKTDNEKHDDDKKKSSPKKEDLVQEDSYVEIEAEDGEENEPVKIEDGSIGLDSYASDINFIVGENGCGGQNLVKNGFCYMWAGSRANKGAKGGKVGYEVKILEVLDVDLPKNEDPINAIRVGWSAEYSVMQLGEAEKSYGYESSGKLCSSSSFVTYGESFGPGDVIGTFLDLESDPKTLKYTKNGKDLGVAMSLQVNLEEKPLFPHILLRNMKVELNFGGRDEPWFAPLEEYNFIQKESEDNIADKTIVEPQNAESCEILLMVGLPNSGKTTWAKKFMKTHPEKLYNPIGLSHILDRCRIEGRRRTRSDVGHIEFMQNAIKILGKLYELCPKKIRNYIYDQNNVYDVAQQTKVEPFKTFDRKAVVVVPTHDNLRKRTSDTKRKLENINDIPFGDLCDMKCKFNVPEVGTLFHDIIFTELDEKNARKTVGDYQSDGARAKRTGRDEFYPKKKPRNDDRSSYGRRDTGRYSSGGGRDRDEGWRSSGSGYGGGYASGSYGNNSYKGNRNTYGSGGGYKGRSPYQDRRQSGGSSGGGYRQHSSYGNSSGGGNYNKGGSYGSAYGSSYNSSGYGNSSSNYGSGYGSSANSYNSGSYGSNYNNQGYNQAGNRGGNTSGGWGGQYGSTGSTYNQSNQGSWGSHSGGTWGGYNYNGYNYNNSGSGSSGNYGSGGGGGYSY